MERSMATSTTSKSSFLVGQPMMERRTAVPRKATNAAVVGRRPQTSRNVTSALENPFADGIFAPAVRITRQVLGKKQLNKIRGKGIALHSQVITSFCKQIGAPAKTKQGLIRLAKKNGEYLGFLV